MGKDEEMIDVGLAAHLPARPLDEPADSISLLHPRPVKKDPRDIPAAARGEMPSWVTASSLAGPSPVAPADRPIGFVTILGFPSAPHEIPRGYAARAPETVRAPWKLG